MRSSQSSGLKIGLQHVAEQATLLNGVIKRNVGMGRRVEPLGRH